VHSNQSNHVSYYITVALYYQITCYIYVIGCTDRNNNCASWARTGECQRNPGYMLSYCRRSCNHCSSSSEPSGNDGMYEWNIYDKMKKTSTLSGTVPTSNRRNRSKIDTPTHLLFDHCIGCPSLIHGL